MHGPQARYSAAEAAHICEEARDSGPTFARNWGNLKRVSDRVLPDGWYQAWQGNFAAGVESFTERYGRPPTVALVTVGREVSSESIAVYHDYRLGKQEAWFSFGLWEPVRGDKASPEVQYVSSPLVGAVVSAPVASRKQGRPPRHGRCPFCNSNVAFEDLGYWWGWEHGIEPPYWQGLRAYVLARDGRRCVQCGKDNALEVHHVQPKESGGKDGARNLRTLCRTCHEAEHL
ncbi:MAG: HNH endonuclease [Gammaproteobacteria bacterium]